MLPEDVLLEVFKFYVDEAADDTKSGIEAWQTLVHVCRLWRNIVFGSPRRLNLRLVCTPETPVRKALDVWPAFKLPLCIRGYRYDPAESADDTLAALGHSDRIHQLEIDIRHSQLEDFFLAMEVPFPQLTYLRLSTTSPIHPTTPPAIPDSFLGGFAPLLKTLILDHIPFPGLPKFLLSATNLVTLRLCDIPRSGYIPPEAMVTCLPMLTSLRQLTIICLYDRETHFTPPKRSVLPALTFFEFICAGRYLEHLVAHIDAPRLNHLDISATIYSATPQLLQFVGRTPSLQAPGNARFAFTPSVVRVTLLSQTGTFSLKICNGYPFNMTDLRALALARVCTLALPLLSAVENLVFYEPGDLSSQLRWEDDIEITRWLEILRPFTAVKNLYISEECGLHIAPALQELVAGTMIEVLPSLENLFLSSLQPSGPVHEGIKQFVAARQLTVSLWDQKSISDTIPKVV